MIHVSSYRIAGLRQPLPNAAAMVTMTSHFTALRASCSLSAPHAGVQGYKGRVSEQPVPLSTSVMLRLTKDTKCRVQNRGTRRKILSEDPDFRSVRI